MDIVRDRNGQRYRDRQRCRERQRYTSIYTDTEKCREAQTQVTQIDTGISTEIHRHRQKETQIWRQRDTDKEA